MWCLKLSLVLNTLAQIEQTIPPVSTWLASTWDRRLFFCFEVFPQTLQTQPSASRYIRDSSSRYKSEQNVNQNKIWKKKSINDIFIVNSLFRTLLVKKSFIHYFNVHREADSSVVSQTLSSFHNFITCRTNEATRPAMLGFNVCDNVTVLFRGFPTEFTDPTLNLVSVHICSNQCV